MKTLKRLGLVILGLILLGAAWSAISKAINPGYADINPKKYFPNSPEVSFSLGPVLLIPIRWFVPLILEESHSNNLSNQEKDEANNDLILVNALIKPLKNVRIQTYKVNNNSADFQAGLADCKKDLALQGWQTIISVIEDNESVLIMSSDFNQDIIGLVIMVANTRETIFLNVSGRYSPEQLENIVALGLDIENNLLKDKLLK